MGVSGRPVALAMVIVNGFNSLIICSGMRGVAMDTVTSNPWIFLMGVSSLLVIVPCLAKRSAMANLTVATPSLSSLACSAAASKSVFFRARRDTTEKIISNYCL